MWKKYEVNNIANPDVIIEKGLEYKYNKNNIRIYATYDSDRDFFITKHSYDVDGEEIFNFKLILNHKSIDQINEVIDFINKQEDLQIPHLEN